MPCLPPAIDVLRRFDLERPSAELVDDVAVLRFRSAAGFAFSISAIPALLHGIGVVGGFPYLGSLRTPADGHSVVASLRVALVCRRP